MKLLSILTSFLLLVGCSVSSETGDQEKLQQSASSRESVFSKKQWHHGAVDCKSNADPAFDIFSFDSSSFILRQNKCDTFEAPFIYVLVGHEKILILDTGATADAEHASFYQALTSVLGKQRLAEKEILVLHSHSHSDHYQGDVQFEGKANVTLVKPNSGAVTQFFAFNKQTNEQMTIDLGQRKLTVMATPGHQEEAISLYDHQTKWLLTGDTFYPGVIYVKEWEVYKSSIAHLAAFTRRHEVSAVLGAHIEMTSGAGEYYPIGTIYQPNEAPLDLSPESLQALAEKLAVTTGPETLVFNEFIVEPLGWLPKTISKIVRWFSS